MLGDPPSEHRVEKWNSKRSGREGDNQKKPREAIEVSWKNLQIWCFDVGILAVSDTQKCGKAEWAAANCREAKGVMGLRTHRWWSLQTSNFKKLSPLRYIPRLLCGGWVGGWGYLWEKHGLFRAKTPGRSCLKVSWILKQSSNGLERIAMSSCSGMLSCRVLLWPSQRVSSVFFSPFPTLSRRYQPIGICVSKKHVHQVPMFHQQFQRFSQFRIKLFRSPRFTVSPTHITSLKLRPGATPTGSLRGELQGLLTARPFSWQNLLIYYARINFSMIWGARETHRDIFCPLEYLPLLLRESRNVPELQAFSALVSSAVYLSNEAIFVGPGRRPCW